MKLSKAAFFMLVIALLWIAIAVLGRIIPHPPNATPLAALAILSGYVFRKNWAVLITLISLAISDLLLAVLQNQPVFGDWSLFTYSGFIMVAYLAPEGFRVKKQIIIWEYVLVSTLVYWLWTNFGTWLTSGMYTHDAGGFFECYLAALPFLRNALIGNIVYMLLFLPGVRKFILMNTYLQETASRSFQQNR
jgi:hypothetical protein